MSKRIIAFGFLGFLIIALVLYFVGIRHIEFDSTFRAFINSINRDLENFKIEIPSIPSIQNTGNGFVDFFVAIINFITGMWNILFLIINTVFRVAQFIVVFLLRFQDFVNMLVSQNAVVSA